MIKRLLITTILSLCFANMVEAQVIDEGSLKKATGWVNDLQLNDPAKETRVIQVIAKHLAAIRDWHNEHANMIPDGAINPQTGKKLSALERQVIADSSQPKSIRQDLLNGLNADLTPEQVEQVLTICLSYEGNSIMTYLPRDVRKRMATITGLSFFGYV